MTADATPAAATSTVPAQARSRPSDPEPTMTTETTPDPTTDPSTTMRAIVQHRYGHPEDVLHLAQVPRPTPGPDEVLVRVRATGVNTPDWLGTLGEPWVLRFPGGLRRPRTPIRGSDLAGTVVEVGRDVTDLAPGDEVFGAARADTMATPGAFCEYAVAPAASLVAKPEGVSWVDAGASAMSGITALVAVRDVAPVGPGTTVLVNGASGGVGTFMVQLARRAGGEVTGVCSGRNVELVRSLGAEHVIDHTSQDVTRVDERYDVVFDNVANHPTRAMLGLLAEGGTFVPNSVGQGTRLLHGLPRLGWAMVLGLGPPNVGTITCEVDRRNLTELAGLLASDEVRTVVDRTWPLSDTPAAVAHMLTHRAVGNVAIEVP